MKDLFDGKSKMLIVVAVITQIINALMWYGVSRIEKFAGYEFDISGKMGIWPVAFLRFCIFFLLIALIVSNAVGKKAFTVLFLCLCIAGVYSDFKSGITYLNQYNNIVKIRNERYEIQNITLEELSRFADGKENRLIYIGREDCPACRGIPEYLENLAKQQPLKIYYYNTGLDRENNYDGMMTVLEKIGVSAVPSVAGVVKGEGTAVYGGDEITANLERYIHSEKVKGNFFTE